MLIHLVALLHESVKVDFGTGVYNGLTTDWACVVVIGPAEKALDMEKMIDIA